MIYRPSRRELIKNAAKLVTGAAALSMFFDGTKVDFGNGGGIKEANPSITYPSQPAIAHTWGYNTLALWDDFTSLSTIDINNTLNPGYNWYTSLRAGAGNPAVAFTLNAASLSVCNSILTINPDAGLSGGGYLFQTGYTGSTGSRLVGSSIGPNGAYWECRMSFDPSFAQSGLPAWPAFWAWDNQININLADNASYGGNMYTELDFFEAYPGNGTISPLFTDWNWASNSSQTSNTNSTLSGIPNLNDGNFHTYGCLWVPQITNSGMGLIQHYVDGVHYSSGDVTYSSTTVSPEVQSGAPTGWLSGIDSTIKGITTVLSTNNGWPLNVDYVMVWTPKPLVDQVGAAKGRARAT